MTATQSTRNSARRYGCRRRHRKRNGGSGGNIKDTISPTGPSRVGIITGMIGITDTTITASGATISTGGTPIAIATTKGGSGTGTEAKAARFLAQIGLKHVYGD